MEVRRLESRKINSTVVCINIRWRMRVSIPLPTACEAVALPYELIPLFSLQPSTTHTLYQSTHTTYQKPTNTHQPNAPDALYSLLSIYREGRGATISLSFPCSPIFEQEFACTRVGCKSLIAAWQ